MTVLSPFSIPNISQRTNFAHVKEDTQHSSMLQKEIEEFTTEMKTDKDLPNPGSAPITHRVHDQRTTALCVSYSTTTIVRGAVIDILVKHGKTDAQIRADLEDTPNFSFNKMLTLFTGCVSPRSLDGLVLNSRNNPGIIDAQLQIAGTAIDRLVNKTEFEEEGWLRIGPLVEILQKYNVDPMKIELEKFIEAVFYRADPVLYQNFENMVIFRSDKLIFTL